MVDLLRKHYAEDESSRFAGRAGFGFLGVSLGLLGVALLAWGGLTLWGRAIRSSFQELDAREVRIAQAGRDPELQAARSAAGRISRLAEVLRSHPVPARFLDLLETLVPARMQLASVHASVPTGDVTLRGQASNLGVLAESLSRWLGTAQVRSAFIPELTRRESDVLFRAELNLESEAFVP